MGMPSVVISFTEKAIASIKRGNRGVVGIVIKDIVTTTNPIVLTSAVDVPTTLTAANQEQIKLAFNGYTNAPSKVIVYVLGESDELKDALDYFETCKIDWLAVPGAETDGKSTDIASWVKAKRADGKMVKAVLPNTASDCEGIVNFATENVYVNDKEYTTEEYCTRIAGLLAGTSLSISATYATLPEITDCSRMTKEERDKAVDDGKFIVWHDGEKVKTGRAVNSLTTTTSEKGESFTKIKIVEAMDVIYSDIRQTAEDSYIGKYANTYDNKCLLISAIGNYFQSLIDANVLSGYEIGIDIEANKAYLKTKGVDVDALSDEEIKKADTGSNVYLTAKINILDAIEDITLPIAI